MPQWGPNFNCHWVRGARHRFAAYLHEVARVYGAPGGYLSSLVVFGSAATGGYVATSSDVDLLLVLRDDATEDARESVRLGVAHLEAQHGLAKPRAHTSGAIGKALAAIADQVTANVAHFSYARGATCFPGNRLASLV